MNTAHSILISIFFGVVFFLGVLIFGTDLRERIQEYYFGLGRSERVKFRKNRQYASITIGTILLIIGGVFIRQEWQNIEAKRAVETMITPAPQILSEDFDFSAAPLPETHTTEVIATSIEAGGTTQVSSKAPVTELLQTPKNTSPIHKTIGDVFRPTRYIGLGDTGQDAEWIQIYLKRTGYYIGVSTKTFDTGTIKALNRFMQAKTGSKKSYTQLGPKNMTAFLAIAIE